MDYQNILDRVHAAVQPIIGTGNVASYIPELAKVPGDQFGIAMVDLAGNVYQAGAAETPFSIQSISKLFALTLAFYREGDSIWSRVGREPSGTPFNSLIQLEQERGKPRNPFINAGALVITDLLLSHYADEGGAGNALIRFIRKLANNAAIGYDRAVAASEQGTSHRNAAMANFMKSFGNLHNDVHEVIETYCRDCAIEMSCVDLARAVTFLANRGAVPVVRRENTRRQFRQTHQRADDDLRHLRCGR